MNIKETLGSRPGLSTAIGVVFAIVAGLLLLGYLSQMVKGGEGGPVLEVPVARADIEMGAVVSEDMITSVRIPSRYLVPGTIKKRSSISGSQAIRFIGKGEPFTRSAVTGPNGEGTLAARIPADLRAYSLHLARGLGGGSPMRPGDKVDVLATTPEPPSTTTLLRERLVLSVSGSESPNEGISTVQGGSLNITLLVSPSEAEVLAQAECTTEISVALCPKRPH
jgi:Flp pilus assembly protein CpaB